MAPHHERETVKAEHNLASYMGKDDAKRKDNRTWYHERYQVLWTNRNPEPEDLSGNKMTIDQSLRLLGVRITTTQQCEDFFNDTKRKTFIKDRGSEVKRSWILIHPDQFNNHVADEEMRKLNGARFAALTNALKALEEWDEIARKTPKQRKKYLEDNDHVLKELECWESRMVVAGTDVDMNYDTYKAEAMAEEAEAMAEAKAEEVKRKRVDKEKRRKEEAREAKRHRPK